MAQIAEPATAAWVSLVVIVSKDEGFYRMFIYYRKLDAVTMRYTYPLPRKNKRAETLGDAVVFPTLNAGCG